MTLCSDGLDLFLNGHIRYMPLKEDHGIERLPLGGGGDFSIGGKVLRKGSIWVFPMPRGCFLKPKCLI